MIFEVCIVISIAVDNILPRQTSQGETRSVNNIQTFTTDKSQYKLDISGFIFHYMPPLHRDN